jgi:ABC-type nitrate/sulfonate/bicarbonate transport system permease component
LAQDVKHRAAGGAVAIGVHRLLFGRFKALAEVLDPYITALYSIPKSAD